MLRLNILVFYRFYQVEKFLLFRVLVLRLVVVSQGALENGWLLVVDSRLIVPSVKRIRHPDAFSVQVGYAFTKLHVGSRFFSCLERLADGTQVFHPVLWNGLLAGLVLLAYSQRGHERQLSRVILVEGLAKVRYVPKLLLLAYLLNNLSFFSWPWLISMPLKLCFASGMYFDLAVYDPKKEELRNFFSSRDALFIKLLDRLRRSLRLLIGQAIKNYS